MGEEDLSYWDESGHGYVWFWWKKSRREWSSEEWPFTGCGEKRLFWETAGGLKEAEKGERKIAK